MATLYELKDMYLHILDMATDPEIEADAIADTLEALDADFEDKADAYAKIKAELERMIDSIKAEEQRLKTRRAAMEKNVERLKSSLFEAMKETGKTKFKTDLFTFTIAKNGGKLPVVIDVAVEDLPDDLVVITEKADVEAIRKILGEDGDCKYAHYGERGESLRIR